MNRFGTTAALLAAVAGMVLGADAWAQNKRLVVYSSNESTLHNLVFPAFQKETGIQVDAVEVGSGVVMRRIAAEKDRPQGDIVWGLSRLNLNNNKEFLAPYRSKNRDAIPAEFRDADDHWIGTNLHLLVILANTNLVTPAVEPKGWEDLLAPRWKDKVAVTEPSNSGSAYINLTFLAAKWGNGKEVGGEKLTKLLQNTKVVNKSSLIFSGVGTGEYALGFGLEYAGYLWKTNGAPVKVIYPADGSVAVMEGVGIVKGGPNPEAAKQFVEFVTRKDVRELILSKTFRRPTRQDLDLTNLPGGLPQLSAVKVMDYDEAYWAKERTVALEKLQDLIQKTR
ncbi:MAG: extracellular solute-binding protein [Alphaproteobacteria bacterium]|nr:extracellular solute-binding protein [Alphaproteobacteria bacterium]